MTKHGLTISPAQQRGWLLRGMAAMLLFAAWALLPTSAHAGIFVSVRIAPPILPVYEQPMIPGPGYIWTPGYWGYADDGYYWVPGTWVLAPFVGALWTPGYWGWSGGFYEFHRGYWGRHVGFYGGINYGYGYGGRGYDGGHWGHGGFYYNRAVTHVSTNITRVYNHTVINNTRIVNRVSFNGGRGGLTARPSAQEMTYSREHHVEPVAAQREQRTMASRNPSLREAMNHGNPPIAATPRAGEFGGRAALSARDDRRHSSSFDNRTQHAPDRSAMAGNNGHASMRSASFAPHGDAAVPAQRNERDHQAGLSANRYESRSPADAMRENERSSSRQSAASYQRAESYQQHARPALRQHAEQPHHAAAHHAAQQHDARRHEKH